VAMSGAHRAGLRQALDRHHASENTRLHALYMFYFLGFKQARIAFFFKKSPSTVSRWIEQYEKTGTVSRQNSEKTRKYGPEKREWLRKHFLANPLSFLDEAKVAFELYWNLNISSSTIWRILQEYNFTHKVNNLNQNILKSLIFHSLLFAGRIR
jgi:transposase